MNDPLTASLKSVSDSPSTFLRRSKFTRYLCPGRKDGTAKRTCNRPRTELARTCKRARKKYSKPRQTNPNLISAFQQMASACEMVLLSAYASGAILRQDLNFWTSSSNSRPDVATSWTMLRPGQMDPQTKRADRPNEPATVPDRSSCQSRTCP